MTRAASAAFLLVACACATTPGGAPLPMGGEAPTSVDLAMTYQREGEIHAAIGRRAGVSNSYGRYRVVGPATSLSVNQQGRWGGTLAGQPLLLDASAGRIQGAGVDLTVRRAGPALSVSGLWRNARLDLTFQKDQISGTPGAGCSIDLRPADGTAWRGFLYCPAPEVAVFQLEGAAGELPDVAMPQWLLAFLGVLPEGP
jgi:hypothetical protein